MYVCMCVCIYIYIEYSCVLLMDVLFMAVVPLVVTRCHSLRNLSFFVTRCTDCCDSMEHSPDFLINDHLLAYLFLNLI